MLPQAGDPGTEAYLLQPGDVRGVGHLAGGADGGDTPAGALLGVYDVGLERDDRPAGRGGDLAAPVRPDDDVAALEGEVDQLHGGQRLAGVDDPPDGHPASSPRQSSLVSCRRAEPSVYMSLGCLGGGRPRREEGPYSPGP